MSSDVIRDTRARGADRFHWSVLAPDQSHTVAAGHTGRIARGPRRLSGPSSRIGASNLAGRMAMTEGPLRRLFWRVVDALDYLLTMVRLRILDVLAGPEPETPSDQQRDGDREGVREASPRALPEGRDRR
jgi:hypothetical protein